jgi:hypothetical protein
MSFPGRIGYALSSDFIAYLPNSRFDRRPVKAFLRGLVRKDVPSLDGGQMREEDVSGRRGQQRKVYALRDVDSADPIALRPFDYRRAMRSPGAQQRHQAGRLRQVVYGIDSSTNRIYSTQSGYPELDQCRTKVVLAGTYLLGHSVDTLECRQEPMGPTGGHVCGGRDFAQGSCPSNSA